jgi:hypothetical protein
MHKRILAVLGALLVLGAAGTTASAQTATDTKRVGDTHLVVHVAVGSHANYFTAGTRPIALACIPPLRSPSYRRTIWLSRSTMRSTVGPSPARPGRADR